MIKYFFLFPFLLLSFYSNAQNNKYDVCVYGGTAAGVIAAYTAVKMGKSVVLIEPGKYLGGLTTGGLGYTDIGNKYAITGLSLDFYRRVGKHYGKFEQWIFEPHVAEEILLDYMKRSRTTVLYKRRIVAAKKENGYLKNITVENSEQPKPFTNSVISAKVFIDCSYEGDLMAKAGVSYSVGREENNLYGETYNGVQLLDKHQFPDGIDPYKIPGDSSSGLLWGISPVALQSQGSGDKKVQAYNFRLCLTNRNDNRIAITKPNNYDPTKYVLLLRYLEKKKPVNLDDRVLNFSKMPNNKTDINNNGPFSTDMIGMNYNYPEADYGKRFKITQEHKNYIKGLLYFIGNDERVPQYLRNEMLQWGYPKDEYKSNDNWSPQMYVREARRMIGKYIMTQHNCEGRKVAEDGVGMAAYTMDSHNCQRIVVNGMVKNEGDVQVGGFGPYPISYRSLMPKEKECKNLLVPVCMSATHIAYGSIRMEPVFMVLAQSAAVAAVLAIDNKQSVQDVDVKKIQSFLKTNPLVDGSEPEILIDNDDKNNVKIIGNWVKEKSGSFGPSRLISKENDTSQAFVQFLIDIKKADEYNLFTYFSKIPDSAPETTVEVFDGVRSHEMKLKTSSIIIAGQTSGEWVSLGKYPFKKGSSSYVKIYHNGKEGVVVADAVLLVPKKN